MNKAADTLEFPNLPLLSLSTADELSTRDLCAGRMTIVGMYSTCPCRTLT